MGLKPLFPTELLFAEIREIQIAVLSWSNAARSISLDGATKHGMFALRQTTNSDRSQAATFQRVPEVPVFLHCEAGPAPIRRGELFIRISLIVGGRALYTLAQGYFDYNTRALTYPPGIFEDSIEGSGVLRSVAGTDPAAGSEISETVPTNARWQLRSMRFRLVTSADVGDRRPGIIIDDGSTTLLTRYFGVTQAASLTRDYEVHFGEKADDGAFDAGNIARIYLPAKAARLLQGWRIRTTTVGLFAADNYGAPQLNVEEWIED